MLYAGRRGTSWNPESPRKAPYRSDILTDFNRKSDQKQLGSTRRSQVTNTRVKAHRYKTTVLLSTVSALCFFWSI